MATFTVTTLADENDSGATTGSPGGTGLSLREALTLANAAPTVDTIQFDAGLFDDAATDRIILTNGELAITDTVTIDGDTNGDDIADVTISGNNASRVFNIDTDNIIVALESLAITEGNGAGVFGGAVNVETTPDAILVISDTTITDSAANRGGGLSVRQGTLILTDSLIEGNTSTSFGGGINISSDVTATITNTTIDSNISNSSGGGVFVFDSDVTFNNSTITRNQADADGPSTIGGGGLDVYIASGAPDVTINNTVIAENISGYFLQFNDVDGTINEATNSFFGTTATITTDVGSNSINNGGAPGLGELQDNGGSIFTRALNAESPLFNAGSNAAVPAGVTLAANDVDRISIGSVDIGAFESPVDINLFVTTASDVVDASDGLTSLREAVAFANSNADASVITFAAGAGQAFEADALIRLTEGQLTITRDVTIDGSTAGGEVVITGDADGDDITVVGTNITDVAASFGGTEGAASDLLDDNSRVFNITSSTTEATLTGLTITGGRTTSTSDVGGGIFNDDGSLTVTNSIISGNSTSGLLAHGGGIYSDNGALTVTNSTISGNSTSGGSSEGGGIYSDNGALTVTNSTISGNSTSGGNSGGGGISNDDGTLTVSNSTISDNSTSSENSGGGGIYSRSGDLTVTNSTISGNSTSGGYAVGGGIYSRYALQTVTNSTVSGNSTAGNFSGGGGIHSRNAPLTVTNATISGNSTSGDNASGGGIFSDTNLTTQTTTITNSTIYNNTAADAGGGIFNRDGLLQVFNSTVSGNEAAIGGGIASYGNSFARTELSSTIVAGNTATNIGNDVSTQGASDTDNSFVSLGNNLIGDGQVGAEVFFDPTNTDDDIVGTTLAPIDPLLGPLADNGGPVQTLALLSGSPVINAGNNDEMLATDGRGIGFSRTLNGNADIGAFESAFDVAPPTTGNDVLTGTTGNDTIDALAGNDTINGLAGNDTLIGGAGADVLNGGDGSDTVSFEGSSAGVIVNLIIGEGVGGDAEGDTFSSIEHLTGSAFDDIFVASDDATPNVFFGGAGADIFLGLGGNDALVGGAGNDLLLAGLGDDVVFGEAGDDIIEGSDGNDTLDGGADNDLIFGQGGDDRISGRAGADILLGGNDGDIIEGGTGNDTILGGAGVNDISGGEGDDLILGGNEIDFIFANAGNDVIEANGGDDDISAVEGDNIVLAGEGNDLVIAGAGIDALVGGGGNDTIDGGAGADTLVGGLGDDELNGGDGADQIISQFGSNTLNGGSGADFLEGAELGDVLNGGADNDFLNGLAGNDTLNGGGGSDTLIGGLGADVFMFDAGIDSENVLDFEDNIDQLDLTAFAFADVTAALGAAVETVGGAVFFDFGDGNTALINNITEAELSDDILV